MERLLRMKKNHDDFNNLILYSESSLEQISAIIKKEEADIVIIDSLQMLQTDNSSGEK
jgi:predicted ATP-dependent serine protease